MAAHETAAAAVEHVSFMTMAGPWLTFASAWMLVMGPLFQAVGELRENASAAQRVAESLNAGSLNEEAAEAVASYMRKAQGWLFVALGGLFLAAKETWEIVEHAGHDIQVFGMVMAVMTILSVIVARKGQPTAQVVKF